MMEKYSIEVIAKKTANILIYTILALVSIQVFSFLAESGGVIDVGGLLELHLEIEYDILVIVLVAILILISTRIAHEISLPPGVIELVMGALLAFNGVEGTEILGLLAAIGANLLLFMAGSEIDLSLLRSILPRAALVASLSAIPPIIATAILTTYFSLHLSSALVVLAALSATSVAITYLILSTFRLLRSRTGQLILASAMMLDVAGMIILNIATAAINPTLAFYVIILLAAVLLYPLLPRLSGTPFEAEIRLITMAVIILGFISDFIGIHGVLTSFILGVVASETVRNRHILREKLESLATGFFTPFFFIASGMSISPDVPLTYASLAVVGGILLAASRSGVTYLLLRSSGTGRRSSVLAASGISPLLTVTIISATIGYSLGLIDEVLFSLLIWTVIGTILGSFALTRLV
ncbi:MAG: cation:proton antiporter [Aeropyrum sp.]|nr:cation:proton antiporter [Aeropyrum sp.]MCE4616570.1 cation:proton antiporter [Aeropyrum sp.]